MSDGIPPSILETCYISRDNNSNFDNEGKLHNEIMGSRFDDDTFRAISLNESRYFPFGKNIYSTIYISSNGLITFQYGTPHFTPRVTQFLRQPSIAVPWNDYRDVLDTDSYTYEQREDQFLIRYDVATYGNNQTIQILVTMNLDNHSSPGDFRLDFGTFDPFDIALLGFSYGQLSSNPGSTDLISSSPLTFEYPSVGYQLANSGSTLSTLANESLTFQFNTDTATVPSNGETNVSLDSDIEITFDEDVFAGTGNVTIKRVRDDEVIEVIDVRGSQVSFSSNKMTINPSNNLEFDKSFYVEIDSDAVEDSDGNKYAGLSGSTSFSFSTICFSENTPLRQLVNGQIQETPIKNLQTGDTLMTKHGPQTLSRLVKQPCYSETEYVFFPQGCFQENLPSQDLWVTGAHPISLGYVPNKKTNGGKSNPEQDDHVFIHMQAADLVGKLPGIEKVKLSESHVYNLIFDIHTSVDVAGMEFLSHHPNPHLEELPKLNSWEYQDSKKTAKKDQPYYLKYKNLIRRHRPKGSELSQFLSQCVSSDHKRKFKLGKLGKNDLVVKKKETHMKAM